MTLLAPEDYFYNKVEGSLCVFVYRRTYMVLPYSEASHRSWEGVGIAIWERVQPPHQEKLQKIKKNIERRLADNFW